MRGSISIGVYNVDSLLFDRICNCCSYLFFEKNIKHNITYIKSIPSDYSCFDILFIDIQNMISSSNNSLKKYLLRSKSLSIVIANDYKSLLYAFEINAFRAFMIDSDENTINKAILETVKKVLQSKKILINNIENTIIRVNDILYIEALGNESIFITKDNTFVSNKNLKYWQDKLEHLNFFRCHKSYIVSLNNISTVNENNIIFNNNTKRVEIIVSRRKKTKLK